MALHSTARARGKLAIQQHLVLGFRSQKADSRIIPLAVASFIAGALCVFVWLLWTAESRDL